MMGFLLFKPQPRSIGMIGLGGGSLAKFCYRYLSRTRIRSPRSRVDGPDGIIVVNLQHGDPDSNEHLARIRRSFNGSVVVVDDGEEPQPCVYLQRRCPGNVPPRSDSQATGP